MLITIYILEFGLFCGLEAVIEITDNKANSVCFPALR